MAQIFGIWNGGSSYWGEDRDLSVEMFNSFDAAIQACQERMDRGHWQTQLFDYLNRDSENVLTPCVEADAFMDIYFADPTEEYDYEPDAVVRVDDDTEAYALFTA